MAETGPELIGIIVAGSVAGVVLLVVFALITVYCYRTIDHSSSRKLMKKKRMLMHAEGMGNPLYYGDTASSVGTTAHLVPPPMPVMYGYPYTIDGGYHSAATTLEKTKHKKSRSSHRSSPRGKNNEREERVGDMIFQEENADSKPGSIRGDNPAPIPGAAEPADMPVIVTYLGDPVNPYEETDVKAPLSEESPETVLPPPAPPLPANTGPTQQKASDAENSEQNSNDGSDLEEGSEAYHRRQREPPKGDVDPPAEYHLFPKNDNTVLY